ncbi:hypothetical protein MD484_g5961, partial [Candolleomyces efflorescens]
MINLANVSRPSTSQRSVNDSFPQSIEQTSMFTPPSLPPQSEPFHSRQTLSEVEPGPGPQARRTHDARPNRYIFQDAQNIQMGNLQFIEANNAIVQPRSESIDGWQLLLAHAAPNALHNSRVRYDAPKCDEDTRVEITSEITTFLENHDGPQRLLCMTGAAGSGKSALQQTVAEICGRKNILGSAFFFSAADASRNIVDPVIPTIAYELGTQNPEIRLSIKGEVENDPLLFNKALRHQITALIVRPFEHLARRGLDLHTLPHTILIDGLDECINEDQQAELLVSITECLLVDHLPFRIFIASRPEWAIRSALQRGGYLHTLAYHIQLSDDYDASGDMCRYLQRRFYALSPRSGNNPHWFSQRDIDTLVSAASGQFVYVATAFNYISERRGLPMERLKIILTWTPNQGQRKSPFKALDILYVNILSTARAAYEALDTNSDRDFLLLLTTYHNNTVSHREGVALPYCFSHETLSRLLGLEPTEDEALFSDLRSLLTFERDNSGSLKLRLYHKSFSDFLQEQSRAKDLFVPRPRICSHTATCCMQIILERPALVLDTPEDLMIEALPFFLNIASVGGAVGIDDEVTDFSQKGGWLIIDEYLSMLLPEFLGGVNLWLFPEWINNCRGAVDHLAPEAGEPIQELVDKWEIIYQESPRSKMFGLAGQPLDFLSGTNATQDPTSVLFDPLDLPR